MQLLQFIKDHREVLVGILVMLSFFFAPSVLFRSILHKLKKTALQNDVKEFLGFNELLNKLDTYIKQHEDLHTYERIVDVENILSSGRSIKELADENRLVELSILRKAVDNENVKKELINRYGLSKVQEIANGLMMVRA